MKCLACGHGRQEESRIRLHAEQEGDWYMMLSTLLQATVHSVTDAVHDVVSRSCLHSMTVAGAVDRLLGSELFLFESRVLSELAVS